MPNAGLVATTLAVVLVGKPLVVFVLVRALRYPASVALMLAAALAQIGEFSFVMTALGRSLGVVSERATQAVVLVAMTAITLNPLLFRAAKRAAGRFA